MKYIKTIKLFEALSPHWSIELMGKMEFEREDDIRHLTYDFSDMGMKISIHGELRKNGFESTGHSKTPYYNDDVNLYKTYKLSIHNPNYHDTDINKIIEVEEYKITLFKRLMGMYNFILKVWDNTQSDLVIYMYTLDDEVDKSLFMESKKSLNTIDEVYSVLRNELRGLGHIERVVSGAIIAYPDLSPLQSSDIEIIRYECNNIYNMISHIIDTDKFEIKKVKRMLADTEPTGVKISLK